MAKIDTSKIDGYEGMTAEEKLAALEGFEYDDYSSELDKHKNLLTKANSEAADYKKKYNALLSDDKKKQEEKAEEDKKILEELDTLRKEKKVSEYKASLMSQGFDSDTAEKAATALADGDMKAYFDLHKQHNDSYKRQLEADLINGTGNLNEPGSSKGMTLEKLRKMSQKERLKFAQEHPEEYKKLYGG